MMFRALGLALADLGTAPVLKILLQALAVTLLVFLLIGGLITWLLAGTDPCSLIGVGSCVLGLGSSVIGAVGLTAVALWFLFPAIATAVISTFTDRIVRAIEERHYPAAARSAEPLGALNGLLMGLRSAGRLLLFNLLALPFYLVLLVTAVGPFLLFVVVNGIAFGRDIAELASARHGDSLSRKAWIRRTSAQYRVIGIVVSALYLVPFVNFLAPVIGAAAGVHLFNATFWSPRRDDVVVGPHPLH